MLTKSQGYTEAIAYVNGNNVMSIGGGICQVSTNLYQCAKKANMKIIERHTHGKEVTYTKNGQDATVTYGLRNLIFQNIYKYPIKINVTAYGNITICKFYKVIAKK